MALMDRVFAKEAEIAHAAQLSEARCSLLGTLTKRVREREAVMARAICAAEERRSLSLVRGNDRNSRDAYIHGLVFAAVANAPESKLNDREFEKLLEVGVLLRFSQLDIDCAISRMDALPEADKMALMEECVRSFEAPEIMTSFLSEFKEVWIAGGGSETDLKSVYCVFENWAVPSVRDKIFAIKTDDASERQCETETKDKEDEIREATLSILVGAPNINGDPESASSIIVVDGEIRNRKILIDSKVRIPFTWGCAELLVENCIFVFKRRGFLEFQAEKVTVRNSSFIYADDDGSPLSRGMDGEWLVTVPGTSGSADFIGCCFQGDNKRGAAWSLQALKFHECLFAKLGQACGLVDAPSVEFKRCRFANCRCTQGARLISADDVHIYQTTIENCIADSNLLEWGGRGHSFEARESKLKNCAADHNLLGWKGGRKFGFAEPFGFLDCCFVNVSHKDGLMFAYESQIQKQTNMSEEEYDSLFGYKMEVIGVEV